MVLGLKRTPFQRQHSESIDASTSHNSIDKDTNYSKSVYTSTYDGVEEMNLDEGLNNFAQNHRWDPNLPEGYADRVHDALKAHDVEAELAIERGLAEQSPYPEVQAAVRNYDEVGKLSYEN